MSDSRFVALLFFVMLILYNCYIGVLSGLCEWGFILGLYLCCKCFILPVLYNYICFIGVISVLDLVLDLYNIPPPRHHQQPTTKTTTTNKPQTPSPQPKGVLYKQLCDLF